MVDSSSSTAPITFLVICASDYQTAKDGLQQPAGPDTSLSSCIGKPAVGRAHGQAWPKRGRSPNRSKASLCHRRAPRSPAVGADPFNLIHKSRYSGSCPDISRSLCHYELKYNGAPPKPEHPRRHPKWSCLVDSQHANIGGHTGSRCCRVGNICKHTRAHADEDTLTWKSESLQPELQFLCILAGLHFVHPHGHTPVTGLDPRQPQR